MLSSCWRSIRRVVGVGVVGVVVTLAGASPAWAKDLIYWGNFDGNTIAFANLDGSGGGGQLDTSGTTVDAPDGLAIDSLTGRLYWANFGTGSGNGTTISFANLGGGAGGVLNPNGATVSGPDGPAIDPVANKIYWANSDNTISFASLNGAAGGQLDTTGAVVDAPDNVAIDRANGRIYWANSGDNTIYSARLDNTGGGEQLNTGAASIADPNGIAIDVSTGRLYWANGADDTHPIAWALTDNSGTAANLDTTGATASGAFGVALDPAGGKLYWANCNSNTISFVHLDGTGGGGQLGTDGTTPDCPGFPVLLKAPSGAGAPLISGGSAPGGTLTCSTGSWAPDLIEALLYQAPQSFAYSWTRDGTAIAGATSSSIVASSPGRYACTVTAANHAGSSAQTSVPFTVIAAPTAAISKPGSGGTYVRGQSVTTTFGCNESSGGPGLTSCDDSDGTSTVSGGSGHVNTSSLGAHTYTVTAISKDGQTGTASISYTVVRPLAVSIRTARATVSSGKTKATVACSGGPPGATCRGRVSETVRRRVVRMFHNHRKVTFKTTTYASARYTVSSGKSRAITLRLTHAGLLGLKHAATHRVRVQATATLTGGKAAKRTITLQLKPKRTRHK
jgi:DNA-binding beta-propeller fold protein YncE